MTDIVTRLRFDAARCEATFSKGVASNIEEAAAEIERLQELLRGTGANRYWEGRWRDENAEVERLRAENDVLRPRAEMFVDAIADRDRHRVALRPFAAHYSFNAMIVGDAAYRFQRDRTNMVAIVAGGGEPDAAFAECRQIN